MCVGACVSGALIPPSSSSSLAHVLLSALPWCCGLDGLDGCTHGHGSELQGGREGGLLKFCPSGKGVRFQYLQIMKFCFRSRGGGLTPTPTPLYILLCPCLNRMDGWKKRESVSLLRRIRRDLCPMGLPYRVFQSRYVRLDII